jgi:hypothetical protein
MEGHVFNRTVAFVNIVRSWPNIIARLIFLAADLLMSG